VSTCQVRSLKVLPGAGKNSPDFMTLLNHAAPRTQEQRSTILDTLNRAVTRGDKLFTVTDTHQHIDRALYTYMTAYLAQAYRLSTLIDKPTLFINSWLIRLWVDNVLLINTGSLSILIDKSIPLSIGIFTLYTDTHFHNF
jgi:hypothetical protein